MGLSVPTSLVLDLFGAGIGDDSFCCFCIKGLYPVLSNSDIAWGDIERVNSMAGEVVVVHSGVS